MISTLHRSLWIDFKLYFYVRIHKFANSPFFTYPVVNWFQIVFLREDSQVSNNICVRHNCCELISNCIFTWGFTSMLWFKWLNAPLWIDFKLYFYVRIHKARSLFPFLLTVVNWFQIVFLREDSQGQWRQSKRSWSCELISNCIFTWGFTRNTNGGVYAIELWIDFKLYFYVRIHKMMHLDNWRRLVVNWFQIVFLREDSQVMQRLLVLLLGCELISNCIFTWGFTRVFIVANVL